MVEVEICIPNSSEIIVATPFKMVEDFSATPFYVSSFNASSTFNLYVLPLGWLPTNKFVVHMGSPNLTSRCRQWNLESFRNNVPIVFFTATLTNLFLPSLLCLEYLAIFAIVTMKYMICDRVPVSVNFFSTGIG